MHNEFAILVEFKIEPSGLLPVRLHFPSINIGHYLHEHFSFLTIVRFHFFIGRHKIDQPYLVGLAKIFKWWGDNLFCGRTFVCLRCKSRQGDSHRKNNTGEKCAVKKFDFHNNLKLGASREKKDRGRKVQCAGFTLPGQSARIGGIMRH